MKKPTYSAYATCGTSDRQWTVCICSLYDTVQEATEAAEKFKQRYQGGHVQVLSAWIRQN